MDKKLLLLLLILLLAGLFWIIIGKNIPVKIETKNSHPLTFFDKDTFYAGIEQAKKESKFFTYPVTGGIIPHHLYVGFIIADFFNRLSAQHPKTIILIGPNHYEQGNFKALTSRYGWQTPFGVVEPNELFINELIKENLIKVDEKVVSEDHAVAGSMPFVKYYLPNVQVVPILLSGRMTEEETHTLASNLKVQRDKDTVVIAAVDFSHYLTNQQAQEKDKVTLEVMKNFDYRQLFSLNNDYLDSPPSIAALLMLMQMLGTTKMDLIHHTNSGELQKDNYIETTSYFSIAYANTNSEFIPSSPTIDQIFSEDHSWTNTLSSNRKRVLIATGDVIPARVVNVQATKYRNFKWPFEKTSDVLRNADITFINLETSLIKNCPLVNGGMKFCGDDKNIEGLLFAGVDVASLANNHAGDYGLDAINYTKNLLNNNGILVTGLNGPVFKDVRGLKFAFLGYNDIGFRQTGISWVDEAIIQYEIAEARRNADIVVVTFHWGAEYRNQPDERQKYLGRFTIDAGADLVIGNHPHWIQPVEVYKDKLITYAHGNFIFDQEWSQKTKEGVIGKYTFYDDKLVDVEYLPIQIRNFGQPSFLEGMKKKSILEKMQEESFRTK